MKSAQQQQQHAALRVSFVGAVLLLTVPMVAVACGGGKSNVVEAPQTPNDNTTSATSATSATNRDRDDNNNSASPCTAGEAKSVARMLADLSAEKRSELAQSMRKGVVVVAYDCKGSSLRVLASCQARNAGGTSYTFAGHTLRESVVQVKSGEGDAMSGAVAVIGRETAAVEKVARDELIGDCNGATHFLRSATVGAIELSSSTTTKGRSRSVSMADGSLEACRKAPQATSSPPTGCRALIQAELVPIPSDKAARGR